jgi:hypothetical protein
MTELEYEKSCRGGNQTPVVGELPWGNTSASAQALKDLVNIGAAAELADDAAANIHTASEYPFGPVRTGIFARGSSIRSGSGAGYYGNMDLGGNLWERVVTIGNNTGRAFSGNHGDGKITPSGEADVAGWPAAAGTGWRGGAYNSSISTSATSSRASTSNGNNTRDPAAGGRGVRTHPTGIVTDGLVLWLDAGTKPSYPGSGSTWTDLSGNRKNGTLVNGPTFSGSNGGSIVFDGVNDYISTVFNRGILGNQTTLSCWFKYSGTAGRTYSPIFGGIDGGGTEFFVGKDAGNTNIGVQDGNYNAAFVTGSNAFNGDYHHIAYTYENGTGKIYLDGVLRNTGSFTKCNDAEQITIGYEAELSGYLFVGNIALVNIYSRVLSSSEVLQNFNAQKSIFGL